MFNNNVEQAASALKDMAIMGIGYFNELKAQGFNDKQAFAMVIEWQKAMMGVGVNK